MSRPAWPRCCKQAAPAGRPGEVLKYGVWEGEEEEDEGAGAGRHVLVGGTALCPVAFRLEGNGASISGEAGRRRAPGASHGQGYAACGPTWQAAQAPPPSTPSHTLLSPPLPRPLRAPTEPQAAAMGAAQLQLGPGGSISLRCRLLGGDGQVGAELSQPFTLRRPVNTYEVGGGRISRVRLDMLRLVEERQPAEPEQPWELAFGLQVRGPGWVPARAPLLWVEACCGWRGRAAVALAKRCLEAGRPRRPCAWRAEGPARKAHLVKAAPPR